jgi:hypothetical protein
MVQNLTNESSLPSTSVILTFLNKGLEEVCRLVGGPRLWAAYPTENNQTSVQLNADVEEVLSLNFSSGANNSSGFITTSSPLSQGTLVYPMVLLEQATFMDAAAGFPAVGYGPPQAAFVYQDQGTAPTTTLPTPDAAAFAYQSGTSNGVAYTVVLTYTNAAGETSAGATSSYSPSTTEQGVVNSPAGVSNATGYNVYVGTSAGPYYLQNTSPIALGSTYTLPGTPTLSGTQPPATNTATGAGTGGALWLQLYPAAMIGQVNVYYKARPQLWADTTTNSWTNLDTSAQQAAVLFGVICVLYNRGRGDEAKQLWEPQYKDMVGDGSEKPGSLTAALNRRTVARSGQVRDVRDRSFPSAPWWLTSP